MVLEAKRVTVAFNGARRRHFQINIFLKGKIGDLEKYRIDVGETTTMHDKIKTSIENRNHTDKFVHILFDTARF